MALTDAPNTTTLAEGVLQPTTKEQAGSRKVISVIDTLLNTPALPTGTTVKPVMQSVQANESMATPGLTGQVVAATPTAGTVPTITGQTVGASTAAGQQTTAAPARMTAAQVAGSTPTMTAQQMSGLTQAATAATGTVSSDATVKGQLENINKDIETSLSTGSALPAYLRGVAKATQSAMADRGLSSSTMMAEALADGLLTASIPIAKADADTYKQMVFQNLSNRQQANITNANSYFQMDMANLSNKQQASLQNLNVRQSFLLSDQAAANAATQFNANSKNQVDQFYSNLSQQIKLQNAARSDAMNQFAVVEGNKISGMNANNQIAVDNFFQEPSETYKRIRFVPPNDYDVIDAVHAYIINDGVDKYVEILNNFPGRAVLRKLISTDGDNVKTLLEKIPFDQIDQSGLQIPPTYPGFDPKNGRRVSSLKFDLGEEKFSNDSVFSGIIWLENQNKEYKFTATPYFSAAKENPVTPTPLTEIIHKNSFIKYSKEDNSVRIPRGKWTVKDFIKLPEGISLILESGASVEFEKNAGILVRAHVDLQGSSTHPIVLKPVDMVDGWAGLTVMNANQWDRESRSILKNVTVSKTNAAHFGTWKLTGGVNFYNSNVDIINVKFERSMAEDSLNIIHSDFLIKEVVISDSHSDAFDGDFVNGSVMNSQFKSIGGDAIDISGSNIQLSDSTFEFVKDKAISVGEASNLKASGLVIKSSGTGVASKDGSSAHITNSTFKDIGYSTLMAYTKKKQYGRATLVADDINYEPRFNAIVAQKKSGIILNGTLALSRKIDIDKLYQDGYMKK